MQEAPRIVFSSNTFLFAFLPLVLGSYLIAPRRTRNGLLLAASLVFYAWGETTWVGVMLVSIVANWALGRALGSPGARPEPVRRAVLAAAVVVNLGLLGFYKYADLVVTSTNDLLAVVGGPQFQAPGVHLPLGISFFTFHALSYIIDVYRGVTPPQRRLDTLALYISLFPQLVAGPIIRYGDVHEQLQRRTVGIDDLSTGITRFVQGLGKKVLIANPLGGLADVAFATPADERGAALAWAGMLAYTLQIYFDFSGYSDMAIGLGRTLGFRFRENFDHPYIARSIQDFWRRWHISLSTWFRDYLYIPLGGNRVGRWRGYANLYIVFLLCGLWHGASPAFVLWGLLHGSFLVLERTRAGAWLGALPVLLQHTYALAVVMAAWVLFRAAAFDVAWAYYASLAGLGNGFDAAGLAMHLGPLVVAAFIAGTLFSAPLRRHLVRTSRRLAPEATRWMRPAAVSLVLALSSVRIAADSYNPFIYFRF